MKYGYYYDERPQYYDELPAYIEDLYAEAEELQAEYEASEIFEDDEYFAIQKHIFRGEPLPEHITADYVRRVIEVEEIGIKAEKAKLDARTEENGYSLGWGWESSEECEDYRLACRWQKKLTALLSTLKKNEGHCLFPCV